MELGRNCAPWEAAGHIFGYTLRIDPDLKPLRSAAKFQQMMMKAAARADAQPRPKK